MWRGYAAASALPIQGRSRPYRPAVAAVAKHLTTSSSLRYTTRRRIWSRTSARSSMIWTAACVAAEDGSAMTQARRDLILHKPERAIAEEFGMTLEEVQQVLDEHPVERDRDSYLRRTLAQQLLLLDRLEVTFGRMAFENRDTAAGALLVKVAERKATLLGLNAPIGHAVRIVQHAPENRQTSTDKIEAALNALIEDQRRSQANDQGEPH